MAGVGQERGTGPISAGFDPRRVWLALSRATLHVLKTLQLFLIHAYTVAAIESDDNTLYCLYCTTYINCLGSTSRFIPTSVAKQADKSCWTTNYREFTSPGTATNVRALDDREGPPNMARLVEQWESAIGFGIQATTYDEPDVPVQRPTLRCSRQPPRRPDRRDSREPFGMKQDEQDERLCCTLAAFGFSAGHHSSLQCQKLDVFK